MSGLINSWELKGGQLATTANCAMMDDLLAIVSPIDISPSSERFRGTILGSLWELVLQHHLHLWNRILVIVIRNNE